MLWDSPCWDSIGTKQTKTRMSLQDVTNDYVFEIATRMLWTYAALYQVVLDRFLSRIAQGCYESCEEAALRLSQDAL
eukprot:3391484-Rhodomonas_salina.1